MAKVNGSFVVEIPRTGDLEPPALRCDWEAEFDGDADFEKVLLAYYRKSFEKALEAVVTQQARGLTKVMASLQAHIDAVRKARRVVEEQTDGDMALAALDRLKRLCPLGLKEDIRQCQQHLEGAVVNIRKQQLAIFGKTFETEAMAHARKSIRREILHKRIRHGVNLTLVGMLVLGTAASIIVSSIASFGTSLVPLAGLSVAGAAIAGASALLTVGQSIKDVHDLERRSIRLLVKNATEMADELSAASTKADSMGKHVNDVSMWFTRRREITTRLQARLRLMERNFAEVREDTQRLRTTVPNLHKAQMTLLANAESNLVAARHACEASSARDEELRNALKAVSLLVAEMGKIPYGGAKGVADNLTRLDFKDPVTYIAMIDALGGLSRACATIGKSQTHR